MTLEADYDLACKHAACFDLSAHGKIEAAGKEAAAFLHNLCTNDIKRLTPGQGCEAFFTSAKARVSAHAWIQCLLMSDGQPGFWIDAGPGQGTALFRHLDHYLISEIVTLTDRTEELAAWHLAGPQAAALVEPFTRKAAYQVWRHDRVALPGYDLFAPAAEASDIHQALSQAGVVSGGEPLFHRLRIEAGMPALEAEIDATRLAMELGRTAQAICYTKGCYLGQETIVMARDRGQVNRSLLGLKLATPEPVPAGTAVFHGAEEIGQVTSSAFSPRVGTALALAFLRRGHQQPGTEVEVAVDGVRRSALVTPLPFISP